MGDKLQYKLTGKQKREIAQNLIDILEDIANINTDTVTFICNWILTQSDEKGDVFFDVWDIVLKNYLPTTRPILFRACEKISEKNKIASFTGRLECARKFSKGKGYLIICDTNETLEFTEKFYNPGDYKHTFYPLSSVLKKAIQTGGSGFSKDFLNEYIDEDEYIMKVNLGNMNCFKWM